MRVLRLAVAGLLAMSLAACQSTTSDVRLPATTTLTVSSSCQKIVQDQDYGTVVVDFCPGVVPNSQPATVAKAWAAIDNDFDYRKNSSSHLQRLLNDWYMNHPSCRNNGLNCYPVKGQTLQAVCTVDSPKLGKFVAVLVGKKTVLDDWRASLIYGYTNKGDKPIGWTPADNLYVPPSTPDCTGLLHGPTGQSQLPADVAKVTLDPNN